MDWTWEKAAAWCEETYGTYVDYEEELFECPECGEPIYKVDWLDYGVWTVCPICCFNFATGEMEEEDELF